MPTYEYACPKCGIVEVYQSIKDDALTKCPQCKKAKVSRMVSQGAGVIFKGSGFWETDYNRSADYQKKKAAEKSETGTAPAADAPAKTDAKPDAKQDAKLGAKPAEAKSEPKTKPEPKPATAASPAPAPKTKPAKP